VEGNFSGWRDRRSGVIWFDDIAELDCNAARAKCLEPQSSLMHRYPRGVPAPEELVVALDNGLTEVYPSLLSQYIWAHANPAYFQYHHRESDMVVYERNRATSDATFSCNTVRTIICSAVTR